MWTFTTTTLICRVAQAGFNAVQVRTGSMADHSPLLPQIAQPLIDKVLQIAAQTALRDGVTVLGRRPTTVG